MNKFAITSGGIGEALHRSASALSESNVTLDEAIGLITSANTVVQDVESVGTGLKTLSLRIRSSTTELEDMGAEVDEYAKSSSKLRDELKALTGVDIMKNANEYKSIFAILEEISKVYDDLTDVSQANILEILFGKRQANIGAAILGNFDIATNAMEASLDSAGSAQEEYDKWLNSAEAKQKKAQAAFQGFSSAILSSELIKFAYDSSTGILGFFTSLTETIGALPVLAAAASAALSFKNVGFLKKDAAGSIMPFWNVAKSNQTAQGSKDSSALNLFADLMEKDGVSAADAFAAAMSGASDEAKKLASSTDFSRDAIKGFEAAQMKSVASTGKFGAAMSGLGSIIKSITASLVNMGAAFLIGLAISEAYKAISNAVHYVERLRDAADTSARAYNDTQAEVEELNSELDETIARIKELEGKTLTFVEKEELANLQKQNDLLRQEIQNRKELAEIKNKDAIADITRLYNDTIGSGSGIYSTRYVSNDVLSWLSQNAQGARIKSAAVDSDISQVDFLISRVDALKSLVVALQQYESGISVPTGVLDFYGWTGVESDITKLREFLVEQADDIQAIVDQYTNIGAQVPAEVADAQSLLYNALHPAGRQEKIFNNLWGSETEYIKGVRTELEEMARAGELTAESLASKFPLIAKAFEVMGISAADAAQQMIAITEEIDAETAKASIDAFGDSLAAIAEKSKLVQDAISEQAESGFLSYETYQKLIGINGDFANAMQLTAAGYQISEDALWGYIEAQGEAFNEDALVAMAKLQRQLNDTESQISILQDRYEDLDDADKAYLDTLYDEAALLGAQINRYGALTDEINAATSAYNKWLHAKSTKNQDEMFNESKDMYELVKEGRKTGKTGTDDFESAIEFITGVDKKTLDTLSQGELDTLFARAEKTAARYSGNKDERTGAWNFVKDLAENYSGATLEGDVLTLDPGTTLADIATAMKVSEDYAQTMFNLMEAYRIVFDWSGELSQAEVDYANALADANAALAEQEELLAELESKDTSGMSADEAAQHQAKLDQIREQRDAAQEIVDEIENNPVTPVVEPELSPLEQLKADLTEIQEQIANMEKNGINIPVVLSEDAIALQTMVTALSTADGLSLDIQAGGVDAAKTAIESVQTALQYIKDNPNISTTLSAQLSDMGKSAIMAIGQAMGWDEETINMYLNPTDNVTPVVTAIESAGGETEIVVDANTDSFDGDMSAAETGGDDGYTADIAVTSNAEEIGAKIDAIAVDRESTLTIKPVMATIPEEDIAKYGYTTEGGYVYGQSGLIVGSAPEQSDNRNWGNPDSNFDYSDVWGNTSAATEEASDNTADIADNMADAADSAEDFWSYFDSKEASKAEAPEVEYGEVVIDQDAIDSYIGAAERLSESAEQAGIETTDLGDAAIKMGEAYETLANTDPADTESYSAAAEAVTASVGTFAAEYATLSAEMSKTVTVPVDANTSAASREIDKLSNKVVTIKVQQKMSGPTYATGTRRAKPGIALVDEEGPELIEHTSSGGFTLGSPDGARLANLKAGDVVHTADETKKILKRNAATGGKSFALGGVIKDIVNKAKSAVSSVVSKKVSGSSSVSSIKKSSSSSSKKKSSSSSSKSSSSSSGWKAYVDKLFDWIEVRLEKLQKVTDDWSRQIERAVGYLSKNDLVDSALNSITTQIEALTQANTEYLKQAETIASKTKLSTAIIALIQDGGINIASYDKDTQEKISAYQEWWEKAQDVKEQIEELKDEQRELANQKLDNIIDQYDRLASSIDNAVDKARSNIDLKIAQGKEVLESDYFPIIQAQQDKLVQLMQGRALVSAEFNKQVAEGTLVGGSEAWYEYIEQMNDLDNAIIDTRIDLEELNDSIDNIVVTNLGFMLDGLKNTQSSVEQTLDLIMAQGRIPTESIYRQLISNGMQQIENLRKQNEELDKQKEGLETNSEKYQDILAAMRDNESAIGDILSSQEGWNDAILDLRIDELQRMRDELDKNNQSYQRSLDLQQAIEDLEKAKSQRTVKVLQDGKFVYMRDEEDVASKQRALDQRMHEETLAKFDDAITAIQDSKADSNVWESIGLSPESMVSLFPNTSIEDLIRTVIGTGSTGVDFGLGTAGVVPPIGETNNNNNSAQVTFGEGSVVIQTNNPYEVIRVLSTELGFAFTQELYR